MELSQYFEPGSIQPDEGAWVFWLEQPIMLTTSVAEQIDLFYQKGFLKACNDKMAEMYGYTHASQIIGARIPDLLPATNDNLAFMHEFILNNYRSHEVETKETDKDGKTVRFINSMVGILDDGKVLGAKGTQKAIKS